MDFSGVESTARRADAVWVLRCLQVFPGAPGLSPHGWSGLLCYKGKVTFLEVRILGNRPSTKYCDLSLSEHKMPSTLTLRWILPLSVKASFFFRGQAAKASGFVGPAGSVTESQLCGWSVNTPTGWVDGRCVCLPVQLSTKPGAAGRVGPDSGQLVPWGASMGWELLSWVIIHCKVSALSCCQALPHLRSEWGAERGE